MDKIKLELRFVNDSTYPPSHGEGCVYKFVTPDKKAQVWLLQKEPDGQWDDEGKSYLHRYEPIHALAYFPSTEVMVQTYNGLENEEWFDYDEAVINTPHPGNNPDDYVGVLPLFMEQSTYMLPKLDYYLENGHIYAEDSETGIVRELVEVAVDYEDEVKDYHHFHFYVLSRSENWNWAQVANLIGSQDSKMPYEWKKNWSEAMLRYQNSMEITVRDVFVLDGRAYE